MSKLVALMSMSLDGFVADSNDGVGEVFDWYMNSGDVEFQTGGSDRMTFKVSAPSAGHLRSHRSAHVRGGRWLGRQSRVGAGIRPDPPDPRRMAATRLDCPLRDRRPRQRR